MGVPGSAYAKAPIASAAVGSGSVAAGPVASSDPANDSPAKPDLAALRRMFDEFRTLTQDARTDSLIDNDYYNGKQWTRDEKRVLQSRKQPDLVFNRVRPAINGTLGVIKQGQTDPRAYPRNPDNEDASDVASKTLRFVADVNRFSSTKIDICKDYMIEGTGAAIVEVEGDDREIKVTQIRWEEFFYDPRSRRLDFADARYKGIAKWMYADEIGAAYPEAKADVEAAIDSGGFPLPVDSGMQDRPRTAVSNWMDRRKRRLLIVEMYHKEANVWQRCVFYGGGTLDYGPSPYLDEKGKPTCPIEAQSCFIDQDNNRYGLVRDMRDVQDEINKRRSKMLHELNTRLVQEVSPGAGMGIDADEVRKEVGRPDGVIPSGFQIVPKSDVVSSQFELMQEAKAEIERMGPNPAILGRQGQDQSGRASLIRQQAGMTEQAIVFGGIEDWELRVYRQVWARARQYWTAPIWIRVTDDNQTPQFIGLNQPRGAPVTDPQTGQPQLGPDGQPMEGPPQFHPPTDETGQPHPQAGEPIFGYVNQVATMDMDIIVDTTPDTANLQQEQWQGLIDLIKAGYPIPPEALFKASALPNKREIIDEMKQGQAPDPMKQLALAKGQADVAKTNAEGARAHAQAVATMAGADIKLHEAGQPQGADQAPAATSPLDHAQAAADLGKTVAQGQLAHSGAILNMVKAGQTLNPPSPEQGWSGPGQNALVPPSAPPPQVQQ